MQEMEKSAFLKNPLPATPPAANHRGEFAGGFPKLVAVLLGKVEGLTFGTVRGLACLVPGGYLLQGLCPLGKFPPREVHLKNIGHAEGFSIIYICCMIALETDLGSISAPFWSPKSVQNRPQDGPEWR